MGAESMDERAAAKEKAEKVPIDAKLLSDAVIELNISRRSVGLYPREHPITRESIVRAYGFLSRLFEFRSAITLGVAKDALMIDDYVLDRKNPVFREFAVSLYSRGIAAITFYSGLQVDELLGLHELIVAKEEDAERDLTGLAAEKGLRCIKLVPFDVSKLGFAEGRRGKEGEIGLWENYIYGLVEGNLADVDEEGVIFNVPPEEIARFINNEVAGDPKETYDHVITGYLRRKDNSGGRGELFSKFLSLVQNLRPEVKQQFLKRALSHPAMEKGEVEALINDLTADDIEKMIRVFEEHTVNIPESVGNLLHKLRDAKGNVFDTLPDGQSFVDDIEIDESILTLFRDDHFKTFVPEDYRKELEKMTGGPAAGRPKDVGEIASECGEDGVDRRLCLLTLELLGENIVERDDYVALLAKISDMTHEFLETGRFDEVSEIYNTLSSHAENGRFREEAGQALETLFHSSEFVERFVELLRIWGRHNRQGARRLANVRKDILTDPLLDTLAEESDPSVRKFLIQLLSRFGSEATAVAAKRLEDKRWYVVRNIIYLIREAGGVEHAKAIRKFAKDGNRKVCVEAVKTLLHFGTPDALSYVKLYLQGGDTELRDQAVKMAGNYKCASLVPYLVELLEKKDLLGTESYYKVSVVKALGEIGDPAALEALEGLYNTRALFYRSTLEDLKIEIFRSLHNYPRESIVSLVARGMKSKNEEIRTISQGLLGAGRS
jgi:hypothetical protein